MRDKIAVGLLVFIVVAIATWFLIPLQPRRVLHASDAPDRAFVRVLPSGRWALTARVQTRQDPFGRFDFEGLSQVRLYDLRQEKEVMELSPEGNLNWRQGENIGNLSPDGRLLAIRFDEKNSLSLLHIWDLETKERLAILPQDNMYIDWSDRKTCQFSPDGRLLAYQTSKGEELRLWSRKDGRDVQLVSNGLINKVAFSSDSNRVAVFLGDESSKQSHVVIVFDTGDGKELSRLSSKAVFPVRISDLIWMPDNQRVLIVAEGDEAHFSGKFDITAWNYETGERKLLLTVRGEFRYPKAKLSLDGKHLSVGYAWNRPLGVSEVWSLAVDPPEHVGYSQEYDFEPTVEKPFAVVGEFRYTGRLWRVGSPLKQAPAIIENSLPSQIQFNSDRSLLALVHFENYWLLDIWDTEPVRRKAQFRLKGAFAGFGEDGKTFLTLARSLNEWDVTPTPPWRWLIPAWFVEAGLVAWLIRWAQRGRYFESNVKWS